MRKDLYGIIAIYVVMAVVITKIIPHGFNHEEERSIRFFVFFILPPFILFSYATMVQDIEKRYYCRQVSLATVAYWMVDAVLGRWIANKLWQVKNK